MKTKPRRVDFQAQWSDRYCLLMLALGMSNKAITNKTHLTQGQISYRAKKAQLKEGVISRMDYRNGGSSFAKITFTVAKSQYEAELARHLRKHL